MEQRKVLLIIVSVSIVLAAIIGVGLWLFYPRDAAEPDSIAEAGGGLDWEPLDYLRGDGDVPGLEEDGAEDDGDFVVTYGVAEDDERETDAGSRFVTEERAEETARSQEPGTDASATDRAPTEVDRAAGAGSDAAVATDGARTTTTSRPTTAAPAPSPTTTESVAASTRTPVERPASPVERSDDELADRAYWVQAISSPNRDTIEQAQRTLREHQLGTRILTKEIGGTTYFRLRLGPFAVREEAEKFLGWVIEIDGFSDSMIFVDYTTAVVAARSR